MDCPSKGEVDKMYGYALYQQETAIYINTVSTPFYFSPGKELFLSPLGSFWSTDLLLGRSCSHSSTSIHVHPGGSLFRESYHSSGANNTEQQADTHPFQSRGAEQIQSTKPKTFCCAADTLHRHCGAGAPNTVHTQSRGCDDVR